MMCKFVCIITTTENIEERSEDIWRKWQHIRKRDIDKDSLATGSHFSVSIVHLNVASWL